MPFSSVCCIPIHCHMREKLKLTLTLPHGHGELLLTMKHTEQLGPEINTWCQTALNSDTLFWWLVYGCTYCMGIFFFFSSSFFPLFSYGGCIGLCVFRTPLYQMLISGVFFFFKFMYSIEIIKNDMIVVLKLPFCVWFSFSSCVHLIW